MAAPERDHLAARVVLSAVPFVGVCGVTPYVLGLPFFVFWIALWTVLTSACMAAVYLLDPRRDGRAR